MLIYYTYTVKIYRRQNVCALKNSKKIWLSYLSLNGHGKPAIFIQFRKKLLTQSQVTFSITFRDYNSTGLLRVQKLCQSFSLLILCEKCSLYS